MLFPAFLISFRFKIDFIWRYLHFEHLLVLFKVLPKSIFNISLNLNTGPVLLILSCTSSTAEFLLEFGAQGFEVFTVKFPTGHETLNLFPSTLQLIHIDNTRFLDSLCFLSLCLTLYLFCLILVCSFYLFTITGSRSSFFTLSCIFRLFSIDFPEKNRMAIFEPYLAL